MNPIITLQLVVLGANVAYINGGLFKNLNLHWCSFEMNFFKKGVKSF